MVAVEAAPDGRLRIPFLKAPSGEPLALEEVAPLRYRADDDRRRVAFVRDAGRGLVLVPDYPFQVFERVPWYAGRCVEL